jgi:hypothetical protein
MSQFLQQWYVALVTHISWPAASIGSNKQVKKIVLAEIVYVDINTLQGRRMSNVSYRLKPSGNFTYNQV